MRAAIGRLQLKKLSDWNRMRNKNAVQIAQALLKISAIEVPLPDDQVQHAYYRLYAFVDQSQLKNDWDRDRIMREISSLGVPCFSGSCPEIYSEKAFAAEGIRPTTPLPNAAMLGSKSLAFLVHPTLTADDLDLTCNSIVKIMSEAVT